MKKSKIVKIILILSLAAFIGLLGFYIYTKQANKPQVVSQRELYQNQLQQQEEGKTE